MTRCLRACLAATLLLAAAPAVAQEALVPQRVAGSLQALQPLDAADLGTMRGGTAARPLAAAQRPGPAVQFWDELSRPRPPVLPQDGTVSSASRGVR